MNPHPSEQLLSAFVEGDVGEHSAIVLAEHLDACPLCAARVAALEPLGSLFAQSTDPRVPDDLSASILAAASAEPVVEAHPQEVLIGSLLLGASLVLALGFSDPIGWLNRTAVMLEATGVGARALQGALPSFVLATMVLCMAAAVMAAMLATPTPSALERT